MVRHGLLSLPEQVKRSGTISVPFFIAQIPLFKGDPQPQKTDFFGENQLKMGYSLARCSYRSGMAVAYSYTQNHS
jgi:hypothetical protein